jgi:hypothetical protein
MPIASSRKRRASQLSNLEGIRALSIRQPWAELILCRRKTIEIRSWKSAYRAWLLIHASGLWYICIFHATANVRVNSGRHC